MKKVLIISVVSCIILLSTFFIVRAQYSNLGPGAYCSSNSVCASGRCLSDNTCGCCVFSLTPGSPCVCSASQYCNSTTYKCVSTGTTLKSYGESCSSGAECESNYCILEMCGCMNNDDCASGQTCSMGVCTGKEAYYCYLVTGSGTSSRVQTYTSEAACNDASACRAVFQGMEAVGFDYIDYCCLAQNLGDANGEVSTNVCGSGTTPTGNIYCYIQYEDGVSWVTVDYNSATECNTECPLDCNYYGTDDYPCVRSCCLSSDDRNGENNVCGAGSGPGSTGPVSTGGSSQIPNPLKCGDVECVVQMIADFIAELVTVIGTIMIIFGGIQYITSAGSEDKARRAKNTVLYAVIGIAIAVSVDFIIGFLGEVLGRGGN